MTNEEKAKAYDEALERARKLGTPAMPLDPKRNVGEQIFPELAESEDERTRKEIVEIFKAAQRDGICEPIMKEQFEQIFAWLEKQGEHANFRNNIQVGDKVTRYEDGVLVNLSQLERVAKPSKKQGEQKPTDKVVPKFKVGDWVVFNNKHQSIYQVEKIEDGYYILRHTHGGTFRVCVLHDENLRLWSIDDAKDGDILLGGVNRDIILMFRGIGNKKWDDVIDYHCYYDCHREDFILQEGLNHWGNTWDGDLKPATKEQRAQLFQRMKEAGYEWDAEKKELKKIEQKPAWSEEDERLLNNMVIVIQDYYNKEDAQSLTSWLKSLKERV